MFTKELLITERLSHFGKFFHEVQKNTKGYWRCQYTTKTCNHDAKRNLHKHRVLYRASEESSEGVHMSFLPDWKFYSLQNVKISYQYRPYTNTSKIFDWEEYTDHGWRFRSTISLSKIRERARIRKQKIKTKSADMTAYRESNIWAL